MREPWMDDKFRERSGRRQQRLRAVNLLSMAVWAPAQQGWHLKWAALGLLSVGCGCLQWLWGWGWSRKGSHLYSESPVIFQHIWKNVKERSFRSSKRLIQSQESNDTASGELCFSLSLLTLWPPHLPPSPRWESAQHCYCPAKQPQPHCQLPLPHFVNLCSGCTFWYFRPINVHIPMFCLYFNLGVCDPPWADHVQGVGGYHQVERWPSIHWNRQPPKRGLPL